MGKILFVTSRNIVGTSGELRLIKNRASALYRYYGVQTDIIGIRPQREYEQEKLGNGVDLDVVFFSKWNILSYLNALGRIKKLIASKLKHNKYDCVLISGSFVLYLINYVKRYDNNIPVLYDVHGAIEELIEFQNKKINKIYYNVLKKIEGRYLPRYDGGFVVSNALKEYLIKEYKLEKTENIFVVPCATEEKTESFEEKKKKRIAYRKKYNFCESDIVFVYSGGVSPWQCIDKVVNMYMKMKEKNDACKLLFLSHQADSINIPKGYDIVVDKIPSDKVADVLNCGDIGFLLRDDYITNNVAYPNKFLEYVKSGMYIISTSYIYDVAKQINDYKLGILIDTLDNDIDDVSFEWGKDLNMRDSLLRCVGYRNSLIPFVEKMVRE